MFSSLNMLRDVTEATEAHFYFKNAISFAMFKLAFCGNSSSFAIFKLTFWGNSSSLQDSLYGTPEHAVNNIFWILRELPLHFFV